MASFPETVYVLLEGGSVLIFTEVSAAHTPSDVEIYDGETYRDTIDANFIGTARSLIAHETGGVSNQDALVPNGAITNVVGSSNSAIGFATVNDPHIEESDEFTHTAPHFKAKKRTIWTFTRGTGFPHVVWADLVQGTSALAPYQLGMTPTAIPSS